MNINITIIGSTGKLGVKLLNYAFKNNIKISAICGYQNIDKLNQQKKLYSIKNSFILSDDGENKKFFNYLKKKIHIIYFLDYGSSSLLYLRQFIKYNSKSLIAIANKELIIAGGKVMMKEIHQSNNKFIPLDSEHFSLKNINFNKDSVNKIFITASGGPFFFTKKKNFSDVKMKDVLSHPKWKMGKNNLIDSSNFINKILEIFELSHIYDIPHYKIDFLISKEAFIHSIVLLKDGTISFNAFKNDMLLTLAYPLSIYFDLNYKVKYEKYFENLNNFSTKTKKDSRFIFFKYYLAMKKFTHLDQINFMLLNNQAQSLYLSGKINYTDIIPYSMNKISKIKDRKLILKSTLDIVNYIKKFKESVKIA